MFRRKLYIYQLIKNKNRKCFLMIIPLSSLWNVIFFWGLPFCLCPRVWTRNYWKDQNILLIWGLKHSGYTFFKKGNKNNIKSLKYLVNQSRNRKMKRRGKEDGEKEKIKKNMLLGGKIQFSHKFAYHRIVKYLNYLGNRKSMMF